MTNKVTLYKSRHRTTRIMSPFGTLTFKRGKFATGNKKIQKFLEEHVVTDRALGVYVDPKEPEIDLSTQLSAVQARQEDLNEMLSRQQEVKGKPHEGPQAGPAQVVATGTNSANVSKDITASLREKLASTQVQPSDLGAA